jgi:hypothetical protein
MMQNGSIIDGLNNWKRNVAGAMKGQTECAICYSIVSGEGSNKLPDKRCPTCRHIFHTGKLKYRSNTPLLTSAQVVCTSGSNRASKLLVRFVEMSFDKQG